jgi:hypothetical protein
MHFLFLPIEFIESREDIMFRMLKTSVMIVVLILFASPSFAYENSPLKIETVSYSFAGDVGTDSQVSPGKSFELNMGNPIIRNMQVESINMKSERNQRNKVLYRYTENPSDYMHAVQQGYVPW